MAQSTQTKQPAAPAPAKAAPKEPTFDQVMRDNFPKAVADELIALNARVK